MELNCDIGWSQNSPPLPGNISVKIEIDCWLDDGEVLVDETGFDFTLTGEDGEEISFPRLMDAMVRAAIMQHLRNSTYWNEFQRSASEALWEEKAEAA